MLDTNTLAVIVACIWQTEGGVSTHHPYGIMAHYAHTTAKEACENTVKRAYSDFSSKTKPNKWALKNDSLLMTNQRKLEGNQQFVTVAHAPILDERRVRSHGVERGADDYPQGSVTGISLLLCSSGSTSDSYVLDPAFVVFLANRYCPPSVDPVGNANWRKNMILLLKQKGLVRFSDKTSIKK